MLLRHLDRLPWPGGQWASHRTLDCGLFVGYDNPMKNLDGRTTVQAVIIAAVDAVHRDHKNADDQQVAHGPAPHSLSGMRDAPAVVWLDISRQGPPSGTPAMARYQDARLIVRG